MSAEGLIKWALAPALGIGITYVAYKKYCSDSNQNISEILFFPDTEFPCPKINMISLRSDPAKSACTNQACRRLHGRPDEAPSSLIRFLKYLANARKSVDLCIYMFTQSTLADLLLDLQKADVKVRIITDSTEDEAGGSQLERLRRAGIEVKSNKRNTGALMHHKFVIIDDRMLLTGSFNWTNKAVVSNYEAVFVTTAKDLVTPFKNEFSKLWASFVDHGTNFRKKSPWQNR